MQFIPPEWGGPWSPKPAPPSSAPSPELRQQYAQQPIPGWQPYETDPQVRRVGVNGPEYEAPFAGVLGQGLRYRNPWDQDRFVQTFGHTVFMPGKESGTIHPNTQRGMEIGAKSVLDLLGSGSSLFDNYLHAYLLEKNALNPRILALTDCREHEGSVLACLGELGDDCKSDYLDLLNCAGLALYPGEAEKIMAIRDPAVQREKKNEYIRNIVEAFLDRDRYTMEELDYYHRRTGHCDKFFGWESEELVEPIQGYDFIDEDEEEEEEISEELDFTRLGCILPMVCPRPLDQLVKCLVAEEGNETPCWRHYKRLLACGYSYSLSWVRRGSWGAVPGSDDEDIEALDTGISIFNTGMYRMFHDSPDTIPRRELEEDRVLAQKQIERLEAMKAWGKT